MSTSKRKVLVGIPLGIVALTLSVASVAFACTTMGGQTYLDTVNGATAPWKAIRTGDTVGLHGTGLPTYNNLGIKINYMMLEDNGQMYCHYGTSESIAGTTTWSDPNTPLPTNNPTFNIASASAPVTGVLKGGNSWKGSMFLCFGDWTYSAWPVNINVT